MGDFSISGIVSKAVDLYEEAVRTFEHRDKFVQNRQEHEQCEQQVSQGSLLTEDGVQALSKRLCGDTSDICYAEQSPDGESFTTLDGRHCLPTTVELATPEKAVRVPAFGNVELVAYRVDTLVLFEILPKDGGQALTVDVFARPFPEAFASNRNEDDPGDLLHQGI